MIVFDRELYMGEFMNKFIALTFSVLLTMPATAFAEDLPPTGAGGAAGDVAAQTDSRMPTWPWVAGGLALIGAGAAAMGGTDGRHGGSTTTTTTTTTAGK